VTKIDLGYTPRAWQDAAHRKRRRWTVLVWHRGAGKTAWALAELVHEALTQPPEPHDARRFAYVAPLRVQAQDVAWKRLLAYVAPLPNVQQNKQELAVTLPNGATIQLYGADNPDRLRGITLDGAVLDEVAQMPPALFREVLMPALSRPGRAGWCVWIGTPKGANAFYDVYEETRRMMDAGDRDYLADFQPVSRTNALTEDERAAARTRMGDEEYAQEMECSFTTPNAGEYYAKLLDQAERDGRITRVSYEPRLPVETWWDLGMDDATAIWFVQLVAGSGEVRVIDYAEASGEALGHYANLLAGRGYVYSAHRLPHDVQVRELGTGKSRREMLESLGVRPIRVGRALPVADGINAAKMILPRCWFDAEKTAPGRRWLRLYRREWMEERGVWSAKPLHDGASHAADAFREGAVNFREAADPYAPPPRAVADGVGYDPLGRR